MFLKRSVFLKLQGGASVRRQNRRRTVREIEISFCLKTFFSGQKRINRSNKSCFQCKPTEKEPSKDAFD